MYAALAREMQQQLLRQLFVTYALVLIAAASRLRSEYAKVGLNTTTVTYDDPNVKGGVVKRRGLGHAHRPDHFNSACYVPALMKDRGAEIEDRGMEIEDRGAEIEDD